MSKKGFALTETLVVVVFLVSIFTFVYVSIIPLIGTYENTIELEKDIDIVYKLYHVRKLIMSESSSKRASLTGSGVKNITCSQLGKKTFCQKLMEQLKLNNYVLVYADFRSNKDSAITSIRGLSSTIGENSANEIANYADKYKSTITQRVLFLLDTDKHTIAHLYYDDSI